MTQRVISTGGVPVSVPSASDVPGAATTTTAGTVKQAAQAYSVATDVAGLVTDFNALPAKLRAAEVLAP